MYVFLALFWAFVILGGIYGHRREITNWLNNPDLDEQINDTKNVGKAIGAFIAFSLMIMGAVAILIAFTR